jgi:DNA-binding NtrC family response regulator
MANGKLTALCVEQESAGIVSKEPAAVLMINQIEVIKAASHDEALRLLSEQHCDVVLYAVRNGADNGTGEILEFLRQVSHTHKKPIIMLRQPGDSTGPSETRVELFPTETQDMMRSYEPSGSVDNGGVFQGMVGRSAVIRNIFRLIERLAPYHATVLITGETGTGKEMVARAIHAISPRRATRFVICNCAALPESLLESELFGHVKGAFTGAIQQREGLFRHAHGGTIFLDEIGELPLPLQAKLLRVIEGQEIRPVGSDRTTEVDVRIVVATNKDLWQAVIAGSFRKDLFYRLNVARIELPLLRERREDIPLLCRYFLGQVKQEHGLALNGFSEEAQSLLMHYEWSGNIRELKNTIETAALMATGDQLAIRDLPANLQEYAISHQEEILQPSPPLTSIEAHEKSYVKQVISRCQGNKARAAQALGVSRRSLYRRLEKYNLSV